MLTLILGFWIAFAQPVSAADESTEFIRAQSEALIAGKTVILGGEIVHSATLLPRFYQSRSFVPAWDASHRTAFLRVLEGAEADGLRAKDYHLEALQQFEKRESSDSMEGARDFLYSDAFLVYASHFLNGKVNPESVDTEWKAMRREGNPMSILEEALAANDMAGALKKLHPQHGSYDGLRSTLARYQRLKEAGGWGKVEEGDRLKVGMTDARRVPQLSKRLYLSGDLDAVDPEQTVYNEELAAAVKRFQMRHGIDAVGEVGPQTLEALNVSVTERIGQLRLNMERLRWINQELGDHYVMVNIAAYELEVLKHDSVTYRERVIVGKPFRKTPVFSGTMTYLVLNPYWGVPPTILFNDMLPEVKKDPGYLKRKNIRVFQGQGASAREVDPYTIDWASLSRSNFPYTLRQDPGPTNALGQVKFMFPNTYNVYIHDTPSRELFSRTDRAFSSGCIRINDPLRFAEYVLGDDARWNRARIDKVVAEGKEQTVMLLNPLPVHILYLTAWYENGQVHFRKDLYDRDAAVLKALNEEAPNL